MITRSALASVMLVAFSSSGCAHWGSQNVYGDKREVGRRMVGAPQVAETTDSNMSAGFSGYGMNHGNGLSTASGGLSSRSGSLKLTHCVQSADIEYLRPYVVEPVVSGREVDMIAAGGLALAGALTIVAAQRKEDVSYANSTRFGGVVYDPTPAYGAGGVMIGSGLAIGLYSLLALPSAPKPAARNAEGRWTERALVESTGCGLVPGDSIAPPAVIPSVAPPAPLVAPTPAAPRTPADRLRELDGLRRTGAITEPEFQTRKKAILDSI